VVELVRPGVEQVLALQRDPRAADPLGEAVRARDRGRAPRVGAQELVELSAEPAVAAPLRERGLPLPEPGPERLGSEAAPVLAEIAPAPALRARRRLRRAGLGRPLSAPHGRPPSPPR